MIFQRRIDKKIVGLDTSWLRAKHKNLNTLYPTSEWIRAVSVSTHLELNDIEQKADTEARLSIWRKYECLQLCTFLPPGYILAAEQRGVEENWLKNFPLVPDNLEERIRSISKEQDIPDLLEYLNNRRKLIQEQRSAEKESWNNVSYHTESTPYKMSLTMLKTHINSLIAQKIPIEIDLNNQLISMTPLLLKLGLEGFGSEYPSTYAVIMFDTFIRLLRRPKNCPENFSINFDGENIKLTESLLTDIKIAYPILHYIDEFVTTDKVQSFLLQRILPKYSNKINCQSN